LFEDWHAQGCFATGFLAVPGSTEEDDNDGGGQGVIGQLADVRVRPPVQAEDMSARRTVAVVMEDRGHAACWSYQ
jgi:hypothetical protein